MVSYKNLFDMYGDSSENLFTILAVVIVFKSVLLRPWLLQRHDTHPRTSPESNPGPMLREGGAFDPWAMHPSSYQSLILI